MKKSIYNKSRQSPAWRLVLYCIAALSLFSACFDGFDAEDEPYRVGTVTFDENLPPEPRLPTANACPQCGSTVPEGAAPRPQAQCGPLRTRCQE